MANDLVFRHPPPDGPPHDLVFGVPDAAPSGDAWLHGHIALPAFRVTGAGTVYAPPSAAAVGAIVLPGLVVGGGISYSSGTERPLVGRVRSRWQDADASVAAVGVRWQDAPALAVSACGRWQDARRTGQGLASRWQDARAMGNRLPTRWQDADGVGMGVVGRWQDALAIATRADARFQDAWPVARGLQGRYQEALRVYVQRDARHQDARLLARAAAGRFGHALALMVRRASRYQDALPPGPGRRVRPGPSQPEPCYLPSGEVVFREPWMANTTLIFVCERHGPGPEPGATVVVPIRTVYMTTNSLTLVRADTGQPIPAESFSLSIDADSWTWSWSASVQQAGLSLLLGVAGDDPREVIATINGVPYWLCAEGISRERTFGNARVRVQGRGRAAVLDAPYAPVLNHAAATAQTAQQLMALALQINGVGIGWDVAWGVTDWLVPGGTWTHQGTHIGAVLDIASAAGAIVQPHRTAKTLRVLPRYPAMPRDWATLTPDFELPADVAQVEGMNWVTKPGYNRAHVAGTTAAGVLGEYTLTGSAGDLPAPMITHPLITHADAARQRALPILADTGPQVPMSLSLPVLSETGLILPGSLVRYRDTTVTGHPSRLGLVRGMSLQQNWPTLRQTLELETHGV